MKSFKKFTVAEAKDAYCSDKCCGSDVKAEDCTCPPDCAHCNCNSVSEASSVNPKVAKAVQGLNKLGNKMKGRDQKDIRRIEKLYRSGNKKVLQGAMRGLDTDLRDQVMDVLEPLGLVKNGVVESDNLEEFTNWSVRHPTKPTKSYKVKARNTGEALKKAHSAAVKAGDLHKQAPHDSMQYKHVKKEEVELEEDVTITPAPSAAKADARRAGVGRTGETYRDRQKRLKQTQTESLSEEQVNDITAQYINENNITMAELEAMSPEQLDEIIGKAVGGAFKLGAKAVAGTARLAGKGIKKTANRMSTAGRADAAEKKAKATEQKQKDRERIRVAKQRVRDLKQKAADAKRKQNQQNKPKTA